MGLADYFGGSDPYQSNNGPQWTNQDLARRTTMVTNHVRKLRKAPSVAAKMAELPVADDQLIQAVRSSGMWDEVRRQRTLLNAMPEARQARIWAKAGEEQRALLRRSGYEPIDERPSGGGGGLLGAIGGAIGGPRQITDIAQDVLIPGGAIARKGREAVADVVSAGTAEVVGADVPYLSDFTRNVRASIGTGIGEVSEILSPALQKINTGGSVLTHVYRFAREGYERHGDEFFLDPTYWDFKEMSEIWEETGARMGEGYWPEQVHRDVAAIMPKDRRSQMLAKRLASGDTPEDLAARKAKPGTPAYQRAYLNILDRVGDPDFKEALRTLELGKVSFGRDIARNFGIDEGTDLYNFVSGAGDLTFALYADPLLVGGKVLKAFKAQRAFQIGEVGVGIGNVRRAEETALAQIYGEDGWQAAVAQRPLGELIANGGKTTAFNERVVRAFSQRGVRDENGMLVSEALAELGQEVPAVKRSMDALRTYDSRLRTTRIGDLATDLGRQPTADEIAAAPGIRDSRDMWGFWSTQEGSRTLFNGSLGGFTQEHVALPRLTRTGLVTGPAKVKMEEAIDWARNGVRVKTPLAPDEVQPRLGMTPQRVEDVLARGDIAEPAQGSVRLYRVQRGTTDIEELPEHIDLWRAEQRGMDNWWTDDLAYARQAAKVTGPTGRLFMVDAPTDAVRNLDDLAAIPGREFTVTDDVVKASQTELGVVGDWVTVSKRGALSPARQFFLAPAANLAYHVTHRVPEDKTLPLFGSKFTTGAERLLDMGFDLPTKRAWMQELLATESTAARRDILSAAMDNMFRANGVYETADGVNEARRYLYGTRQMFAMDGVDMMPMGGGQMRRVGLGPRSDHADGIMIPSFRDVLAQSQRVSFTKRVFGGINNGMVDAFMGTYWKPAVLLRLGFIPRAAGEELLSTLLRLPTAATDHWVLRPLASKVDEPIWMLERLAAGSHYLRHFIGESWGDHIEELAHKLANGTSGWVRGMAANRLTPQQLEWYRALAKDPNVQAAATRELPAVTGRGLYTSELGREEDLDFVFLNPERTEKALFQHGVSEFMVYPKAHPKMRGTLTWQVQRQMKDPPHVAAMEAGSAFFAPEHARVLETMIQDSPDAMRAWRDLGQPITTEVVGEIRRVANTKLGHSLNRYHDLLSAGPDPQHAIDAAHALADARNLATSPSERLTVEVFAAAPGSVRDALLVNENQILRNLGALDEDQAVALVTAMDNLGPVAEGKTRSFVAAPSHPSDMDPATMPAANQIAWHDDPDNALFASYDGSPAATGFNLYYVDYDEEEYLRRRYEEYLREIEDPEAGAEYAQWVEEFGEAATLNALSADEELLANMRQVPGFSVAPSYDGLQAETVREMMDKARDGDTVAMFQLQELSAARALENMRIDPHQAHFFRENERSIRTSLGRTQEAPVVEGHTRFYVILGNQEGMAGLPLQEAEGAAKAVVAQATDPGEYARVIDDAQNYGLSEYQPISSWAHQSRDMADTMRNNLDVDNPNNYAVGFVDVPDREVGRVAREGLYPDELPNWRPAASVPAGTPEYGGDLDELREAFMAHRNALDEYEKAATRLGEPVDEFVEEPAVLPDAMTLDAADEQLRALGFDMDSVEDEKRLKDILGGRRTVDETDENVKDWANKIALHTNQLTTSPVDGRFLHEIGGRAARQGEYTIENLGWSDIPEQHLPNGVTGPEYYVYDPNLWQKITEKGFGFINRMVGSIAREPLFHHNAAKRFAFAREHVRPMLEDQDVTRAMLDVARGTQGRQAAALTAYREVWSQMGRVDKQLVSGLKPDAELDLVMRQTLDGIKVDGLSPTMLRQVKDHFRAMSGDELTVVKKYVDNQDRITKLATDTSLEGAVADTIPFIDDHKIRSQYSEFMRNITPFHFAEEQMLKRWARVLVHSPEALRRAQLTYMGLRHSGIIRQNQYGDDVWVIPGTAQAQQVLAKGIESLTGEPYTIPVSVPFTGEVKMTLPGFNRVGAPSFSPVLAVPMTLLARRFPELNEFNRDILGEQAVGRPIVDQLLPTSVKRVYDAIFSRPDTSSQYASAMIQVMQYMEAENLSPQPPGPNAGQRALDKFADDQDIYIERVKNWTRVMLVNRAIFGFMSPAAPQLEVPGDLSKELQTLMQNLDYEDAISVFIGKHPDATAYTVFTTKSESGASMPSTPAVGEFLDNNEDFVARHKMATPWLLPQPEPGDSTSRSVYATQVKLGLRERKSPKEWIEDLAFAEASEPYFNSRDKYERARITLTDDKRRRDALDKGWAEWKTQFFKMHPLFEQQIQSRDAHNRRIEVLRDTRSALTDPDLPEVEHEPELRSMVNSYFSFVAGMDQLSGMRTADATERRSRLRVGFSNWGRSFINEYPSLAAFWQRNIEPEIGLTTPEEIQIEKAS